MSASLDEIEIALQYVHDLDNCVREHHFNEVPEDWLNLLNFVIKILEPAEETGGARVAGSLALGKSLRRRLTALKLNVIHCRPPMPHSVI